MVRALSHSNLKSNMNFPELSNSTQYVALAGGAAMVVAGWNQVKSIFSYLSSFLIVRAHIDSRLNYEVTRHIRRHWRLVPSGTFTIDENKTMHLRWRMQVKVPYKLPRDNSIYFRGLNIIVFHGGAHGAVSITTFRWTSVENIIKAALNEDVAEQKLREEDASYRSRFVIHEITGRDKSEMGMDLHAKQASGGGIGNAPEGTAESSSSAWVFPEIDKSFMYDKVDYLEDTKKPSNDLSVYLTQDAKALLDETTKWFEQREWFLQRMIPWRRGLLLYGPGGTGKSTFAVILAQKLGIPIYRFHLNTLSDVEFMNNIGWVNNPCVILFEDFDRVFNGRESVKNQYLSFDTVINSMSGVKTLEGVIFIVTTNNVGAIDPAIGVEVQGSQMSSRPGRIDRILCMNGMAEDKRRLMIQRILGDWPELVDRAYAETDNFTIVQTQEYCVQRALERIH